MVAIGRFEELYGRAMRQLRLLLPAWAHPRWSPLSVHATRSLSCTLW
jgi:hypothetical protein